MPTNTDLVTDLPADFEVFGQAVDTSMADLKGGTTGQILSKTTNADMDFTWIANDQGDITGVTATSPLTGGGTSGAITVGIQDATTSVKGSVQLSDSTSTTSSVLAATPTAVKSAYDLAAAAVPSTTNFFAAKNKIQNGDFGIWQRGTSFSSTGVYTSDRWLWSNGSGTVTQQTFTPGTAPVAGYEGTYYWQYARSTTSTAGYDSILQRVEDVRTLAGQTAILSFWIKASASATLNWQVVQNFGSGGSASVTAGSGSYAATTSWVRITQTVTIPSITGKTIGTSSYLEPQPMYYSPGQTALTVQIWGVQLEAASAVSNFQTATGTKQGELAACQRYYYRFTGSGSYYLIASMGNDAEGTTQGTATLPLPVTMRTAPTTADTGGTWYYANYAGSSVTLTSLAWRNNTSSNLGVLVVQAAAGLLVANKYQLLANNSTASYIGFSAEL